MTTILDATIEKETEKAYLVNVTVDSHVGFKGWNVWFPKSRSNWDGKTFQCEDWLINAKNRDLPTWAFGIETVNKAYA